MASAKKVLLVANECIAVIELNRAVFEKGESVNQDGVELLVTADTAKSIVGQNLAHYKNEEPIDLVPVKE